MLRILNITAPNIADGDGVRVTLWVSGCTHHCKGCHTPWTWDFSKGLSYKEGIESIRLEVSEWLSKYYIKGLTISGGDPMCQDEEGLSELLMLIEWVKRRYPNKDIWMYTGAVYENLIKISGNKGKIIKKILNSIDVLVDGPYVEALRDVVHTPFRGSTNQRILDMHMV